MTILGSAAELAGRVKLQISGGARGTIDYPWQDNMILDQGFESLITQTPFSSSPLALSAFGVGGSSQPVSASDVGLIAPIAFLNISSNISVSHGWDSGGGFGWSRRTASFSRGAAAGNISELTTGQAANNTSAMARALVRDALGNPTTITVLSDEVLTMTWEWRKWWTVGEPNAVEYLVDDVPKTTTVSYKQSLSTGAASLGNGGILPIKAQLISSAGGEFVGEFAYTYNEGSGNPQVASVSTAGNDGSGNNSSTSGSWGKVFPYDAAYATFDPPIAKTNEFRLEIRHRIALTRRAP